MSGVRVDGYAKIPEHKWYEWIDLFTRIDEQLEVLIKQLDYTNKLLASIASAVTGLPIAPQPAILHATPVLVKTDAVTVPDTAYLELLLEYDLVLMTPDSDVLIAKSPDEKGFILYAGAYLALRRENEKVFVKAVSRSATLYISYWQVVQQ